MKLRYLWMVAFCFGTVTLNTACPQDIAKQVMEQENLRKEYDDKKLEKIDIDTKLFSGQLLFINGLHSSSDYDFKSKSQTQRDTIRGLLQKYLEINGRLIELSNHKLVKEYVSDSERNRLLQDQISAKSFMTDLNAAEGK